MADSRLLNKFPLLTCLVLLSTLPVQAGPVTDLYEITSGTYTEVGGFAGIFTIDLPSLGQSFLELSIDHDLNTAEMRILSEDLQTFSFLFFEPPFLDGSVNGNVILFEGTVLDLYLSREGLFEYSLVLNGDLISLQGDLFAETVGFDIPNHFYHTGVEASLVPEPATAMLLAFGLVILLRRSG